MRHESLIRGGEHVKCNRQKHKDTENKTLADPLSLRRKEEERGVGFRSMSVCVCL
jgi:hypothetical protein